MQPTKLKIQQLWYFMDAAETGSFTRAAEKNYTSQSNISYAIREMEKVLDVPLFLRRNGEISLTKYGEAFLPYVKKSFEQLEQGCQTLYQMANPGSGTVRVGFSFIFSLSTIPDLFRYIYTATGQSGGQIDLHPVMAHVNDNVTCVEDLILEGSCDLGLTCVRVREDIASIPVDQQELVLLLPDSHPLAGRKKLTLHDVKDEPFILLNGDTEITGNYYVNMFEHDGITPTLIDSGMDWLSLLVEVSAGKCLTIVPRSNFSGYDVVGVELEHPMKYRDIHLAWPTNRKLNSAAEYCKKLILNYYGKS